MLNNAWLKELKVGDTVIVSGRYRKSVSKVEKITPKGFIRVDNTLFEPVTGSERGGDAWGADWLVQATEENINEIKQMATRRMALKLMHDTSDLTYEDAIKIIEILKKDLSKE